MSNEDSRQNRVRVAICGGGIGGLSLAVFLSGHSHLEVQLYEAAGQFKEIGAGVILWARTWRIMEKMGLASEFAKFAHAPPSARNGIGFDFRRSDSPEEGFRFHIVQMPYGGIRFHRAEFLDIFVNRLPAGIAHFGKRLVSYSRASSANGGPITLSFSDGSSATCDVLVGADGIKSCIREQMYREAAEERRDPGLLRHVHPVWTGVTSYRALINVQDIPRDKNGEPHRAVRDPIMYCGKSKHVVGYIISRGDLVNVIASKWQQQKEGEPYDGEWVENCDTQELLDCFAGWEPEVGQLLQCVEKPTRWAIHHLVPLPFYHTDGVVLIGDSAHAMAPNQAAGAGQAIGDSYILSQLLAKATPAGLLRSLDAYQAVRLPVANNILTESYHSGRMYEFDSEYGEDYPRLGPAIQRQWNWIDDVSMEEELESAFRLAGEKYSRL